MKGTVKESWCAISEISSIDFNIFIYITYQKHRDLKSSWKSPLILGYGVPNKFCIKSN